MHYEIMISLSWFLPFPFQLTNDGLGKLFSESVAYLMSISSIREVPHYGSHASGKWIETFFWYLPPLDLTQVLTNEVISCDSMCCLIKCWESFWWPLVPWWELNIVLMGVAWNDRILSYPTISFIELIILDRQRVISKPSIILVEFNLSIHSMFKCQWNVLDR